MLGRDWNALQKGVLVPPANFNFAADVIAPRANAHPDKPAIISVGADGEAETWGYARVAEAVGRLAAVLHDGGIQKGDRVLILMPRTAPFLIALGACHHIGAIPVPCVTQISAKELAYRAQRCAARGGITTAEWTDRFTGIGLQVKIARGSAGEWQALEAILSAPRAAPPTAAMDADLPALMYFTSGTSGLPKAVVLPASAVFVRSWQPWSQLELGADDVIWTTSDTGWTRAGSCLLYGCLFWGATSLIVERNLKEAEKLAMLTEHRVTIYGAVATELRQIMANAPSRSLPDLRVTISAGEAMTAELWQNWTAFSKAPLVVGYGQSETCTSTLTDPNKEGVNGMIGQPLHGNNVTVIGTSGVICTPLEVGEIAFRADSPGLMLGYWRDGAITSTVSADGWYRTGDSGYLDAAGNLFFVGRADDIISSSGYRIGPTEVENALMSHPAVRECAVFAAPDATRGEVVKACVVLRAGQPVSLELVVALQDHVKREIAPYKYPRIIEIVDDLPRTVSGKVSRRMLRDEEARKAKVVLT